MRSFIVTTGILVFAAHVHAQSAPATTTATPAPDAAPALIKTVADDPNDSPMVRAAKRAVRARQNPTQRRVVSLTTSSTATRGRVAISSGATEGPKIPPKPSDAKSVTPPKVMTAQEAAAKHRAEVQEKLRKLQAEEERIGTELDEPYGHDEDEDAVEKRLAEIAAERKKLQESVKPPM
jgi:hypothetical protein